MRLWIDGQCLQTTSRLRGIGRYVVELMRAISETQPDIEIVVSLNAAMDETIPAARALVAPWCKGENIHLWQSAGRPESRAGYDRWLKLSETALAHHVACLAPDVALSASPFEGQDDLAVPLLARQGHDFALAGIFYDAIPHRYPERYLANKGIAAAYRRRLAALKDFDGLLAISDFARTEAEALLPGVPVTRIDAGISPDFIALTTAPDDSALAARLGLEKPFLLYVGGLDWRKNVMGVVEAFAKLASPWRETLQLVLAGDLEATALARLKSAWARAGLDEARLKLLGHVRDATLVQLYKQADLVIQPSRMEGFGLTALEAMSCGAPVIAANAGALPEVVGDARALFDPADPAMIAARIGQFLGGGALRATLVEAGRARAPQFSWSRTARLAADALRRIARKPVPLTREDLRRITRAGVDVRKGDLGHAADILAAAEPYPTGPGRLLIDVTFTSALDFGTGIQRVVNNIARNLVQGQNRQLFWCETPAGLFEAKIGSDGRFQRAPGDGSHQIIPRFGDHLVMLDSTWIYPDVFAQVMAKARLQGCDITTVIYDLVPLKMPAFCEPAMPGAFAYWLKAALNYTTGFVCISRAVADELLVLLEAINFPKALKIGYWSLGADCSGEAEPVSAPRRPAEFLMVSTLEPRKGYGVALEAFSRLWAEGFDGHLTIIGKQGWEVDHLVAAMRAHPQWQKKLFWLERVSDAELKSRYASCTALISSSYGEGYGMPVQEAAFHGKPVIISDLPVFHEIADGIADVSYFPVGSADGLAEAVRQFCRRQAAPSHSRALPLTWAQSAAQFEKVLAGGWYRSYQPSAAAPAGQDPLHYRLEALEGPIAVGKKKRDRKFILRLTNLSEASWFGDKVLAYRLLDGKGKVLETRRQAIIALAQAPGDAHVVGVRIPRPRRRAAFVEFALCDGDNADWQRGLKLAL